MVSVESHGWRGPIHDVTVEDCDLKSTEDSSTWSAEQWNELSVNGIEADGHADRHPPQPAEEC